MERSYLQEEWGQGKFESRTSYATSTGSEKLMSNHGRGAGAPSRIVNPNCEQDWSGNGIKADGRKMSSERNYQASKVRAINGFYVGDSEEAKSKPTRDIRWEGSYSHDSPGALKSSEWKSSYQSMQQSRPVAITKPSSKPHFNTANRQKQTRSSFASDIARQLRDNGEFLDLPSEPLAKLDPAISKVLIVENYSRHIPGCTVTHHRN